MSDPEIEARIASLRLPMEALAELCQKHQVRELALFGSALRDDFGPRSDIDLLVDFLPGVAIDLFDLVSLQTELVDLLGRPVDVVPRDGIKPMIRESVVSAARTLYAAAE